MKKTRIHDKIINIEIIDTKSKFPTSLNCSEIRNIKQKNKNTAIQRKNEIKRKTKNDKKQKSKKEKKKKKK